MDDRDRLEASRRRARREVCYLPMMVGLLIFALASPDPVVQALGVVGPMAWMLALPVFLVRGMALPPGRPVWLDPPLWWRCVAAVTGLGFVLAAHVTWGLRLGLVALLVVPLVWWWRGERRQL